jgi:hypothetical protein
MSVIATGYGDIEFIAEATHGAGLPTTGQLQVPSDAVGQWTLSAKSANKHIPTMGSPRFQDTVYGLLDFELTFDYTVQLLKTSGAVHTASTSLEYYTCYRVPNAAGGGYAAGAGQSTSLAFVARLMGFDILLKASRITKLSLAAAIGEAIEGSVTITGSGIATAASGALTNYSTCTAPGYVGTALETYAGSSITKSGKWAGGVTNGTLTLSQDAGGPGKLGNRYRQANYLKGPMTVELSAEIITAGKDELDDIINATPEETDVIFATGATASQSHKFTLQQMGYESVAEVIAYNEDHAKVNAMLSGEWVDYAAYS